MKTSDFFEILNFGMNFHIEVKYGYPLDLILLVSDITVFNGSETVNINSNHDINTIRYALITSVRTIEVTHHSKKCQPTSNCFSS